MLNTLVRIPPTKHQLLKKVTLSAKEELDIAINQLASDPMVRNGQWGFVVMTQKVNKSCSYNEATPLVPASTTKLLTTDAAMNIMGLNSNIIHSQNILVKSLTMSS